MKNKPNRAFKDSRTAPKKGRPEPKRRDDAEKEIPENEDFVMGRHPVLELLRSDRDVNKLFI
ncbi:MAG TPA: 23S rRNA (guanosine(2251)-2'-O)-methyltransferase RlmB, partial [Trichococcus sp.]|nr:23S rRNA (guanosine(2251)-2'-O)-methyltransferase RlmB [Trichococcus sp.]